MQATSSRLLIAALALALSGPLMAGNDKGKGNSPNWNPEWYLRLMVAAPAENLLDRGNVIGQLRDSYDEYDSHDLLELNPAFTPYLTLVFPHDEWAEDGHYASDYHDQDYSGSDQWVFMVKSDDSYRDVTLYWDSVKVIERIEEAAEGKKSWKQSPDAPVAEKLAKRMWLEDLYTGEQIDAVYDGKLLSYEFNMQGQTTRSFRWVLESKNGKSPYKAKNHGYNRARVPEHGFSPGELPTPAEARR